MTNLCENLEFIGGFVLEIGNLYHNHNLHRTEKDIKSLHCLFKNYSELEKNHFKNIRDLQSARVEV